jgi:hypothetical protein
LLLSPFRAKRARTIHHKDTKNTKEKDQEKQNSLKREDEPLHSAFVTLLVSLSSLSSKEYVMHAHPNRAPPRTQPSPVTACLLQRLCAEVTEQEGPLAERVDYIEGPLAERVDYIEGPLAERADDLWSPSQGSDYSRALAASARLGRAYRHRAFGRGPESRVVSLLTRRTGGSGWCPRHIEVL